MHQARTALLFLSAAALFVAGCANTTIRGTGSRHEQVFYGDVGISGEDHDVTMLPGSQVRKLSIMGEDIYVFVTDGALVDKIEIVGENNEVSCPAGVTVEYSELGEDNRLIHRR